MQQPAKRKKGRGGGNKAGWSLPDVIEEDLVEWLRGNSYLWLRSTKDYKRKKDSWQMKAEELNISLEHLQKWWKNLKDWYVKLLKKTSGQACKTLTGRDKWVLNSLSFYQSKYISCYVLLWFIFMYVRRFHYTNILLKTVILLLLFLAVTINSLFACPRPPLKFSNKIFITCFTGQMQVDLPDTLNTMARSGSASSSSAPAASTSRPLDEDDDEGMHILSDIESQEAQRARDTTTTTIKKTRQQKPEWTEQLLQHLQENHALLERVLLPQPQSLREAFIRYATDVFRTVSDEEYQELQFSFEETMRRIVARRAGAVPPPQASTSTAPPQASTSTAPPQASTSTAPPQGSTSTAPPQASTSTTPSLHQMTPLSSLSRYLWSPSSFYGMDHPPLPQIQPDESPSQQTTPRGMRMSADFTSHQLQEDFP